MGFTYAKVNGKTLLCCDVCDSYGGVRKIACPYGWCQALAMCPQCRKDKAYMQSKENHQKCKQHSSDFHLEQQAREAMLELGYYIRCAALNHGDRVKVIFRNKTNEERAYFMAVETYRSISHNVSATPKDYESRGRIQQAENTNLHSNL